MQFFIFLFVLCFMTACGHSSSEKNEIITVQPHSLSTPLYYSGIIQPLKSTVVTTPAEGVVTDMTFHYGEVVTKNHPLFIISSDKFQTDYKNALMAYIKAKTDFINNQTQLREGEFLHKNQLISDDDFKAKQTNFFNSQLGLIQAKDALSIYLKQMDLQGMDLFSLSIENIEKINQVLHTQNVSRILQIISPSNGIILLPIDNSSEGQLKKIAKGDQVKQGDVLAMIGDMSGLMIHINVNELNVNQLKLGQKVKITGPGFPDIELQGEISGINHQGETTQGGMPLFPVDITVPKLSTEQQKIIHIGMSAKVEIQMEDETVITIPLAAIIDKNGLSYLKVIKNNKIEEVAVKTGKTTQDSVVVTSNLKSGDQVVISH
ncbi:MAG: efflux RND transporter periplasmic adaptor subunit [Gammaproteobacteria bacterium]|nr:efflux RND transporter periplasmic adaptor subunit [Gammaproteobacteria bacterium]